MDLGGTTQKSFSVGVCGWRCTGGAGHGLSRSWDLLLSLPVDNGWYISDTSTLEH